MCTLYFEIIKVRPKTGRLRGQIMGDFLANPPFTKPDDNLQNWRRFARGRLEVKYVTWNGAN